jgi:hypothetical protein
MVYITTITNAVTSKLGLFWSKGLPILIDLKWNECLRLNGQAGDTLESVDDFDKLQKFR